MSVSQKIGELSSKQKGGKRWSVAIQEMREEMKKVSWTSREELWTCGKVVIGTTFVLGLGIYLVDLMIRCFLSGIDKLVRWVGA